MFFVNCNNLNTGPLWIPALLKELPCQNKVFYSVILMMSTNNDDN